VAAGAAVAGGLAVAANEVSDDEDDPDASR